MRASLAALALVAGCTAAHASEPSQDDFTTRVRPLLEKRCQPCHFSGGTLYARLPFDRAATIYILGDKLFTRIRDESERAVLRAFLAHKP